MQTLNDSAYHTYHQDEQGSTAYITGNNGVVENCYAYDAFGNVLESRENIENRILYTGQQYDQETGQYYLRARFYNPVIGRFTQEDTYRGDGLNLYAYCANNPVVYYDPSGHAKKCKKPDQAGGEQQKGAGESGGDSKTITSQSQMQKQVERGQAPKDIGRVDKPHVPGQQPHVHFKDGTSLNQDGTIHDAHRGTPSVSNKVREWLIKNGWETND